MMNLTWVIVIFEIEQNLFLNNDLLVGVAHVHHAEGVVGDGDLLQRDEGGQVGLSNLPSENGRGHAVAQVVFDLVVQEVDGLGRGDDVDAVTGALGDVDTGHQRGPHHTLDGGGALVMEDSSSDDLNRF